ncbi:BglG family transcription antiterminator [Bacillus sp. IITD106]|nr:BglG family transcription antiterminator [Bacillus sp. IITD106]
MYITAREKHILDILLDRKDEITVKELAKIIGVSVRTIHRDLNILENTLNEYDIKIIKKSRVGISLQGSHGKIEGLKSHIFRSTIRDYTIEERQTMILCMLLESSGPVKLNTLANDLRVTIATISNDLTNLEERLELFNLSLVRRRGYGVEIVGSESAKRRTMSYLIAESLHEADFMSLLKSNSLEKTTNEQDMISERLLELIDKEKLLIVEEVIQKINSKISFPIADSAYIGIIVHLALAVERVMQGENIKMDEVFLEELQNASEYKIAEKIIDTLKEIFHIDIPIAEVGFITMHLQGAKLRHDEGNILEVTELQTVLKAKQLIQYVQLDTGYELASNASLLNGLVAHLKPALYRIQQKMGITNPLLKKVREDYEDLFRTVRAAVKQTFPELTIPDEEVGYLVMHFGAAILQFGKESKLKAYVICSSGIGTSKMLATRLRQEIPEIEEVINLSIFELNKMQIDERDLIISTLYLSQSPKEYIQVSPMLTKEEIKQVQSYVRKKLLLKQNSSSKIEKSSNEITKVMSDIQLYMEVAVDILSRFCLASVNERETINSLINKACLELTDKGFLRNKQTVYEALFMRESIGGLGIPGTKLALFHTRHIDILKPIFQIYHLKEPILIKAMDQTNISVNRIFLLLASDSLHEQGLEVLSYISAMIIEDEKSIELFETANESAIQSYMATKFAQFTEEKIKELRRF